VSAARFTRLSFRPLCAGRGGRVHFCRRIWRAAAWRTCIMSN